MTAGSGIAYVRHWVVEQTGRLWMTDPGLTDHDYRRIETPALVMVGDRDDDVPLENGARLYRAPAGAALAVLLATDHFAPVDRANVFTDTVTNFLRRRQSLVPPRPRPCSSRCWGSSWSPVSGS